MSLHLNTLSKVYDETLMKHLFHKGVEIIILRFKIVISISSRDSSSSRDSWQNIQNVYNIFIRYFLRVDFTDQNEKLYTKITNQDRDISLYTYLASSNTILFIT